MFQSIFPFARTKIIPRITEKYLSDSKIDCYRHLSVSGFSQDILLSKTVRS